MTTEGRPVRLTVDGWATTMTDSHGNDTSAVRVRYDGAERAASVLVLTSSPNVTVEDREAPRTWTNGDVVHVYGASMPYVAHRESEDVWLTTQGGQLTDAHIDLALDPESAVMADALVYQAGA